MRHQVRAALRADAPASKAREYKAFDMNCRDESTRLKICEFVKYSSNFASLVCVSGKESSAPS